jgi:ubiquinol-cytochrome c reductase cytochrome b subunit
MSKVALLAFCIAFVILGVLGVLAPTPERTLLARICTVIYFGYFVLMPFYTRLEKTKVVPQRVDG